MAAFNVNPLVSSQAVRARFDETATELALIADATGIQDVTADRDVLEAELRTALGDVGVAPAVASTSAEAVASRARASAVGVDGVLEMVKQTAGAEVDADAGTKPGSSNGGRGGGSGHAVATAGGIFASQKVLHKIPCNPSKLLDSSTRLF